MKVYIKKSSSANFEHIDIKDIPLGKGGQGAVHNILSPAYSAEYCIKIYIREPEKSFEKIKYMVENQPQGIKDNPNFRICWPTALVYDTNKKFIGYMMPLAFPKGHDLTIISVYQRRPLAEIKRYKKYTEWHGKYELDSPVGIQNRIKMLCNVAIALHCIHTTGKYVLVDLKPENIDATGTGKVSIMDTDSIQISEHGKILHPATAFTPDYFAPEGKSIQKRGLPFPVECDYFAAAVCFYQILTGTHPYAGTVLRPPYDKFTTLDECIAEGLFPFGPLKKYIDLPKGFNLQQNFFNLPQPVQELFIRAFGKDASQRPSMEEWGKTFFGLIKNNIKVGASTVKRDTTTITPIKIVGVQYSNEDQSGKVIRSVGTPIYNDTQYLCPHITYQVLRAAGKVDIHYKIISPEGNSSTNDKTFGTIELKNTGTYTSSLGGWGSPSKKSYSKAGLWTIEFYYSGKCIYRTKFEVCKVGTSAPPPRPATPVTTSTSAAPFKITNMQFSDQTKDCRIITGYGSKLTTGISYLTPRVTIQSGATPGKYEIGVKIIGPTGNIISRNNGKDVYTTNLNINAGSTTIGISGWGNESKSTYNTPGTYHISLYYNGNCVYTTHLTIDRPGSSSGGSSGGSTYTPKRSSYSSEGSWKKISAFVSSIGDWFDDKADDWSDSDDWEKIVHIVGGIILVIAAFGCGSILGGAAILIIGGIIGYIGSSILAFVFSMATGLIMRALSYVFYNIWTLILTLVIICGITIAPHLGELDLDSVKSKVKTEQVANNTKTSWYYCTSSDVLNVRKRPYSDSEVIGVLQPKQAVEVYGRDNGFAKIKFEGGIGYASLKYLSKEKPTK